MTGVPCECKGSREQRRAKWIVTQYKCNHSAFNGYHKTPSDYSTVTCTVCLGFWRTTAAYVEDLPYKPTYR